MQFAIFNDIFTAICHQDITNNNRNMLNNMEDTNSSNGGLAVVVVVVVVKLPIIHITTIYAIKQI